MAKIKTLRNKADKLFQIAFVKKNPYCEFCGKPTFCGHHIITKAASFALRYVENNLVAVCYPCHWRFHSKFSSLMIAEITLKRGLSWYQDLLKRKAKIIKTNIKYYQDIIETLIKDKS